MRPIRHAMSFLAVFVFAAGFAGSALADPNCNHCLALYDNCMARPGSVETQCIREHNQCAWPINCPVMPE